MHRKESHHVFKRVPETRKGYENVVLLLLQRGANVDDPNNKGATVFHRVCRVAPPTLLTWTLYGFLLNHNADVH